MRKSCIKENKFLNRVTVTPDAATYEQQLPLADVKDYLIVGHTEDDVLISTLRDAVCKVLEEQTKRPFIPSIVRFTMEVNKTTVPLPRLPFTEVTSISKRTEPNNYEAIPTDQYEVWGDDLILECTGIMQIEYKGGYDIDELDHRLRLAALAEIAYRYENRGDKSISADLCETAAQYIANLIVVTYS